MFKNFQNVRKKKRILPQKKLHSKSVISGYNRNQKLIPLPNSFNTKKIQRPNSKNREIRFKELCIGNEQYRENLQLLQTKINEKYAKLRKLRDRRNRLEEISKSVEKPKSMNKNSKKFNGRKLNLIEENEILKVKLKNLYKENHKKKRFRLSGKNEKLKHFETLKRNFKVKKNKRELINFSKNT